MQIEREIYGRDQRVESVKLKVGEMSCMHFVRLPTTEHGRCVRTYIFTVNIARL